MNINLNFRYIRYKGVINIGKKWEHFKVVMTHKKYVYEECKACGFFYRGILHDVSKLLPIEFLSSAKYFQGNRSPIEAEKEDKGYSMAWLHHKSVNKHHWEWWTDFDDYGNVVANKIPYVYVIEMICDWIGAGKAYTKDKWSQASPIDYYNKERPNRYFNEETEKLVVYLLEIIRDNGLYEFHKTVKKKNKDKIIAEYIKSK